MEVSAVFASDLFFFPPLKKEGRTFSFSKSLNSHCINPFLWMKGVILCFVSATSKTSSWILCSCQLLKIIYILPCWSCLCGIKVRNHFWKNLDLGKRVRWGKLICPLLNYDLQWHNLERQILTARGWSWDFYLSYPPPHPLLLCN